MNIFRRITRRISSISKSIVSKITRRSRKTTIPEINTQPIENRKIKIPEASARQLEQSKPTISKAPTERTKREKTTAPTQRTEKGKMPVSETRKVSTGEKKTTTPDTPTQQIILQPIENKPEEAKEEQTLEIELAKEKIGELKERIKEMDEEGYIPQFSHSWSIAPQKRPNSRGAGRMKETSGNIIIDTIEDVVRTNGYVAVARALEANWDEIIYYIERLEFAIYDGEYRKRSGGRSAYNAGIMRLRGILVSET